MLIEIEKYINTRNERPILKEPADFRNAFRIHTVPFFAGSVYFKGGVPAESIVNKLRLNARINLVFRSPGFEFRGNYIKCKWNSVLGWKTSCPGLCRFCNFPLLPRPSALIILLSRHRRVSSKLQYMFFFGNVINMYSVLAKSDNCNL